MIYCQAILPRTGLGNRLFPWARCRVFSFVNKIPMFSPEWAQVKLGSALRGEYDPRFYHNIFKSKPDEIMGVRKIWIRCLARPEVVIFSGPDGYFQKLNGWNEFLYKEIYSITKNRWLRKIEEFTNLPPIGIHVRRGDFAEAKSEQDFIHRGSIKTPIPWFIQSLKTIRDAVGYAAGAFVVSDGTEKELEALLSVGGVDLVRTGSAIGDLLVLSKARVLIASGGSTFSAWAAFFGQMPAISYPGQSLAWFNLTNPKGYYIGEFNPLSPNQQFMDNIKIICLAK